VRIFYTLPPPPFLPSLLWEREPVVMEGEAKIKDGLEWIKDEKKINK